MEGKNLASYLDKDGSVIIPVGVSGRHVHLSAEHMARLFGPGAELEPIKFLSQPGEFAAKEVVSLVGSQGYMERVRVVGPLRERTQVEISLTDSLRLGVVPPVRLSGDLTGTPGLVLVGPRGLVELEEGVILAARHIHMPTDLAERLNLRDMDVLKVKAEGPRAQIYEKVILRVRPHYVLELHLDTDEANAALLRTGDKVSLFH